MTTSTPRDNPPGQSEAPSTQPETASPSSDFANYQAASSRSTLKTDEYFKRLESAQSAIGKSLLAMLALVAFWLSIENSYYKYVRLEAEQTNQAKLAGVRGSILEALKDNGLVTTQRLSALGASFGTAGSGKATASLDLGNDSVDDFCGNPPPLLTTDALRSVKRQCKEFADNKARLDRIEERIVKLQEEPLDLSILGTKIPSRLAVAAEVWLIALLIWISYFEAKRSAAHCNLAALHLGMSLEERAFGTIPGGSFWLSPVPTSLRVLFSDGTRKKPSVESAASSSAVASQAAKPAELVTSIHDLTKRLNKWKGVLDQKQDKGAWWSHWSNQSKPVAWHHPLKVTTVPRARSGCRQSTGKQQVTIQIPVVKPLDIRG